MPVAWTAVRATGRTTTENGPAKAPSSVSSIGRNRLTNFGRLASEQIDAVHRVDSNNASTPASASPSILEIERLGKTQGQRNTVCRRLRRKDRGRRTLVPQEPAAETPRGIPGKYARCEFEGSAPQVFRPATDRGFFGFRTGGSSIGSGGRGRLGQWDRGGRLLGRSASMSRVREGSFEGGVLYRRACRL